MVKGLGMFATYLVALACLETTAADRTPVDYLEVFTVTPSRQIDHDVEVKGPFNANAVETLLSGPKLFSQAVDVGEKAVEFKDTYLSWYEITEPKTQPRRVLTVRDAWRGEDAYQITIRNSAYLLSPAQKITSGPPSPLHSGLGLFQAYEIVGNSQEGRQVRLTGNSTSESRTVGRAVYFCVPVEQWHHDEHFAVENGNNCLLVYELKSQEYKSTMSTLDQFGLNKLETSSSKWLCVPAQLVNHSK